MIIAKYTEHDSGRFWGFAARWGQRALPLKALGNRPLVRPLRCCTALCIFLILGCSRKQEPAGGAAEKSNKEESRVHHGTNGEVIIKLDAETQKLMGLQTAPLQAAQMGKEVMAFGRALDPSPLASLVAEVTTAQTASAA